LKNEKEKVDIEINITINIHENESKKKEPLADGSRAVIVALISGGSLLIGTLITALLTR